MFDRFSIDFRQIFDRFSIDFRLIFGGIVGANVRQMLTVCGDSMMTLLCGGAAPAYMLAPWVDECRCQGASCLLILIIFETDE